MTFGEKLREIRVRKNLTQEGLARLVSLEKMSISKYESGKMLPSSATLIALCNVLDVSPDYFFRETSVHITAAPKYRMHGKAKLSQSGKNRILLQTESAVANLQEIAEICGYKRCPPSPESLRRTVLNDDDIEMLAAEVRSAWSLGLDPVENLMEVAENHGFTVILVDGPSSFEAAVYIDEIYGPIIALKRGTQREKQRFTLAHELGHYFIIEDTSRSGVRDSEADADRFAAAFLVPRSVLKEDLGENRKILGFDEMILLHQKHGVSIPVLLTWSRYLGIITEKMMERAGVSLRTGTDETNCQEEPRLARKLIYRAVAEGYISERKGSELLEDGFFGVSHPRADV